MKRADILEIFEKHVEIPDKCKREFWIKEMPMFYRLLKLYPNEEFWKKTNFSIKLKSLAYLLGFMKEELKKKYAEFHVEPEQEVEIALGEKVGEDYDKDKVIRTVKQFLSN